MKTTDKIHYYVLGIVAGLLLAALYVNWQANLELAQPLFMVAGLIAVLGLGLAVALRRVPESEKAGRNG